jgi:hypothetical protein
VHRYVIALLTFLVFALVGPAVAEAAVDSPPASGPLLLPEQQFWAAVIGLITPLAGYLLNKAGPQVSQPVKLAVQIAVAAAAGALYQLLDAGTLGLDTETLQVVGTTVISALLIGHPIFKIGNVNARLGGYLDGEPPDDPARAAHIDGV